MKKLAAIIVILASVCTSFAQNSNFLPKQDEFSKEFIRLLDSARKSEFNINSQITFDSFAYYSCLHHNKYQYELVKGVDMNPIIITHSEKKEVRNLPYQGKDSLFENFDIRTKYFSHNKFYSHGECIWAGYTTHQLYKELTSVELARVAFDQFMQSKTGHRKILLNSGYQSIGVSLWIDPEFKRFYITVITGIS